MDRSLFRLVLCLTAATAAAACSAPQTAPTPAAPAAAAEPAAAPQTEAEGARNGVPEGSGPATEHEWLVDEEGNEYRTLRYPKSEGTYRRVDEDTIIAWRGLRFDVAEEGEDHFLLKVYRTEERALDRGEVVAEPFAESGTKREELAMPADLAQSDRLRFAPFGAGLPAQGQWRNGFAVVDFDADGRLDLVHGPARKGSLRPWLFTHDGAGAWSTGSVGDLPTDLRLDYGDVAVADFNRDGHPDLALAVHLRGVVVLVNDGEGRFGRWSEGIPYAQIEGSGARGPGRLTSRALEAVDWNGDGWLDLVALGEGGRMAVRREDAGFRSGSADVVLFVNRGDGSWEVRDLGVSGRLRGDRLATGDFDADGEPDLVTSWMSTAPPRPLVFNRAREGGAGLGEEGSLPGLETGTLLPAVTAGDFDGDGRDDLAVSFLRGGGDRSHGVVAYLAREDGWERRPVLELKGRRLIGALASGRLPGDRHLDLVAFDDRGRGWVFLGDGEGGFEIEEAGGVAAPESRCAGYAAALVDLDGRPGDEIVASFAGESGGEILLGLEARCPSGGGIFAWRAEER